MLLCKWEQLPDNMKNDVVKKYYDILYKKRFSLFLKRLFDIVFSIIILIILSPLFIIISLLIKLDSKGPVFFRQKRVTQYGKTFKIYKFRTMVVDAESLGSKVTTKNDSRVTRIGKILRKYKFDEFPQLLNIIVGEMSFVGTRPEVPKFTDQYNAEMLITLLLPAGVTSLASIYYRNESELLEVAVNVDEIYVKEILIGKMHYNIKAIEDFSFLRDIKIIFMTVFAVFCKNKVVQITKSKGDLVK